MKRSKKSKPLEPKVRRAADRLVLGVTLLILVGFPGLASADERSLTQQPILILSSPAGARIEVNNQYVGTAPVQILVPARDGYFIAKTTIQAVPVQVGQYVQTRHFLSGKCAQHFLPGSTTVPRWIVFEMRAFAGEPVLRLTPFNCEL